MMLRTAATVLSLRSSISAILTRSRPARRSASDSSAPPSADWIEDARCRTSDSRCFTNFFMSASAPSNLPSSSFIRSRQSSSVLFGADSSPSASAKAFSISSAESAALAPGRSFFAAAWAARLPACASPSCLPISSTSVVMYSSSAFFSRALTTDFSIAAMDRNSLNLWSGTPPPPGASLPKILSSVSEAMSKPYSSLMKLATSSRLRHSLSATLYLLNRSLRSCSFFSAASIREALSLETSAVFVILASVSRATLHLSERPLKSALFFIISASGVLPNSRRLFTMSTFASFMVFSASSDASSAACDAFISASAVRPLAPALSGSATSEALRTSASAFSTSSKAAFASAAIHSFSCISLSSSSCFILSASASFSLSASRRFCT
mmetsp:Transcript_119239/g.338081  ORF Transcript_119239/g.338081 Transcript_119239/m.338081 type:complete len:383 (+) Transcript_119239:1034-2182(+)